MLEALGQSLAEGGFVALVLLVLAVLLWGVLVLRLARLRGPAPRSRFDIMAAEDDESPVIRSHLKRFERCLQNSYFIRFEGLVHVIVLIAPLLGLLGTVQGMMETFDTLSLSRYSPPADTMSSGISKAMLTTQMGLIVSLPGLFMHRILKRLAKKRLRLLQQGGLVSVSKSSP